MNTLTNRKTVYMEARPEFMTAADIQHELQISRSSAYNLLCQMEHQGITVRVGTIHRVSRENFDRYFERATPVLTVIKNEKARRKR